MNAHYAPLINFEVGNFCLGDTCYFTNTTQRGITYRWDIWKKNETDTGYTALFTATTVNVAYKFPTKGEYRVMLTADNGHTVYLTRTIRLLGKVCAGFDYIYCGSQFVNLSTCYTKCTWHFGDGTTSEAISPVHRYTAEGNYVVRLAAIDAHGVMDVFTDTIFYERGNIVDASFDVKVYNDSVVCFAKDTGFVVFNFYTWSFGDDSIVNVSLDKDRALRMVHRYARKDTSYQISYIVRGMCMNDYQTQAVFVPDSTPVTEFKVYPNPLTGHRVNVIVPDKKNPHQISVYDVYGNAITGWHIETEMPKGYTLVFDALSTGTYLIKIVGTTQVRYARLVIPLQY